MEKCNFEAQMSIEVVFKNDKTLAVMNYLSQAGLKAL